MYNRYIPQSDGSYQRSRMPDKTQQPPSRPAPERRNRPMPPQAPPPCPPPQVKRSKPEPPPPPSGVGCFLKNLLPKDFDTEDLLVILLLLLMSRDEDSNSALLTMALYLFL